MYRDRKQVSDGLGVGRLESWQWGTDGEGVQGFFMK